MSVRLAPLAVLFLAGCGPVRTGSGTVTTEDRPLSACRGVRVSGQANLTVTRGDTPALSVTWDDNLLDSVVTEVRDGLLEVSLKSGSYSSRTGLQVAVTLPALASAKASGQATVVADVGAVADFTALASGQSKITLRGTADRQEFDASGQSHIDAGGLTGKTAFVSASGQSHIDATGATERVTGTASGQSTVEHAAAAADVPASGQASVRKR